MGQLRDLVVVALLNLAGLGFVVWQMRDPRAEAMRVVLPATPTPGPTSTVSPLHVHVSGAVNAPGLVRLPDGARVDDAVRAAGGLRADADASSVNLAAPVQDGWALHVATAGETLTGPGASGPTGGAGPPAPVVGAAGSAGSAAAGTLDLNRATAAELETLPGIGPALAARIVAYRQERGPFASVEDLLGVSGIGERTLERIRAGLRAGP